MIGRGKSVQLLQGVHRVFEHRGKPSPMSRISGRLIKPPCRDSVGRGRGPFGYAATASGKADAAPSPPLGRGAANAGMAADHHRRPACDPSQTAWPSAAFRLATRSAGFRTQSLEACHLAPSAPSGSRRPGGSNRLVVGVATGHVERRWRPTPTRRAWRVFPRRSGAGCPGRPPGVQNLARDSPQSGPPGEGRAADRSFDCCFSAWAALRCGLVSWVICSGARLPEEIVIRRGFISSGTSRMRSIDRRPLASAAFATFT
jgi:hypothetical protein